MTDFSPLLAQLDGLNPLNPTAPISKGTGMVFKDIIAIIGAGVLVGLILLLFVRVYLRKSKRKRRHHENRPGPAPIPQDEDGDDERHDGHRHHRRRHRLRDHRQRNPTLAETGGLPPAKPEQPSNPPL